MDLSIVQHFIIALLLGALVGLEREKHKNSEHPRSFAGIRTYILFSQMGAVSAWLGMQTGQLWIFAMALLAVTALVLSSYWLENKTEQSRLGLTSELAAITVCLLGGAVVLGYAELAVALAILTSAVLAFRDPLHGLVGRLDSGDLFAMLKLLIASFIVLPLLPNQAIDPWQALNPYKLWLLVILISALSLVGYLAVRSLGSVKGSAVTGLTGGLVSSTAATLSFARSSKQQSDELAADHLAGGILLSWAVMFLRVLLICSALYLPLLQQLAWSLGLMALLCATAAVLLFWHGNSRLAPVATARLPVQNPFSLWSAIQFGLLFAGVLLAVKLVEHYLPGQGVLWLSALAGLTDVDAISLSMADFAGRQQQAQLAAQAILLACVSNTLVKTAMVLVSGSRSLAAKIAAVSLLLVVMAGLSFKFALS
ncbi:MgtC/SapB family protein [Rheinheimera sp.]|uniref:MgtC/SapB family protein n=1 Tax=Rheinheimera sp. TaxID=1869214 RepID=UPI003AF7796C